MKNFNYLFKKETSINDKIYWFWSVVSRL